jgi:hypothetical protein
MRARTLHTDGEQRTVAIVLSTGDEAMACLKATTVSSGNVKSIRARRRPSVGWTGGPE